MGLPMLLDSTGSTIKWEKFNLSFCEAQGMCVVCAAKTAVAAGQPLLSSFGERRVRRCFFAQSHRCWSVVARS
jgi:hypothetical protein